VGIVGQVVEPTLGCDRKDPGLPPGGLLVNATNPNAETQSRDLQDAAQDLGLQLHVLHANSESDFDKAFAAMAQLRVGALVIGTGGWPRGELTNRRR
jgi:hypothetical protein